MNDRCLVCRNSKRAELDLDLAGGITLRDAAGKYGLSKDAIARHKNRHLSKALKTVQAQRETEGAERALDRLESLYKRACKLLDAAEAGGQGALALGAIKELRGLCMDLARITGEYDDKPQVNVLNVASSEEWLSIQATMMSALSQFPDARVAVAGALEDMGEQP